MASIIKYGIGIEIHQEVIREVSPRSASDDLRNGQELLIPVHITRNVEVHIRNDETKRCSDLKHPIDLEEQQNAFFVGKVLQSMRGKNDVDAVSIEWKPLPYVRINKGRCVCLLPYGRR